MPFFPACKLLQAIFRVCGCLDIHFVKQKHTHTVAGESPLVFFLSYNINIFKVTFNFINQLLIMVMPYKKRVTAVQKEGDCRTKNNFVRCLLMGYHMRTSILYVRCYDTVSANHPATQRTQRGSQK